MDRVAGIVAGPVGIALVYPPARKSRLPGLASATQRPARCLAGIGRLSPRLQTFLCACYGREPASDQALLQLKQSLSTLHSQAERNKESVLLRLFPNPLFLLPQFRREFSAKIFGFKHLANFNLGLGARHWVGATLDPFDGFFF